LTTVEVLKKFNSYDPNHIPVKAKVNVTVNCSCGNSQISKDYGLFITYPLRPRDTIQKIASDSKLDEGVIQSFNSGVNFSKGSGIVFIPGRGMFPFLSSLFDVFLFLFLKTKQRN
jgi:chitin elicitor receptor kinase 1